MSKPWVKFLLPVVIVVLALLLGKGLMSLQEPPTRNVKAQPSPRVEVFTIEHSPTTISIKSQGSVSARRQIEWASKVSGRVVWVAPEFVEGAVVEAGTSLLKLDPTDYRVALTEAKAALADARLALAEEQAEIKRGSRYKATNQQSYELLRQPKLAQVEARFKAAEEKVLQARADLAATEVKAPFNAIIDKKQVDLGGYVASNVPLFHLLSTDVAEVRLPITASDIGYISHATVEGQKLPEVKLSARFGHRESYWQGRLIRTERRVDNDTRTFFVVAEVIKPYDRDIHAAELTIGLFVDASIEGISLEHAVRVPRQALHNNQYVYVVIDGQLRRRSVTVFRRERDAVVIRDGLEDGDQVVLTQFDLMVEGMPVTTSSVDGDSDE